ncbi:glycosyltransferase [Vibrio aestuarianus]|nr:glycosyltransferase [Vibrio aestuarianus]
MKKILYISSFLPYNTPYAGSKTAFSILKSLSSYNQIDIIAFYNNLEESKLDEFLDYTKTNKNIDQVSCSYVSNFKRLINALFMFFLPLILTTRFDFLFLIENFRKFKKYDLIHLEFSQALFFSYLISKVFNIKMSVSVADVILQSYQRKLEESSGFLMNLFYFLEVKKLKFFERLFLDSAEVITVQSHKDRELLKSMYNIELNKVVVLSPDFYRLPLVKKENEQQTFNVMLWGAYNRYENEKAFFDFFDKCLDRLNEEIPNFKFIACGVNPTEKMINSAKANDSVVITGFVEKPEDVFSTINIAVVPLSIGAGIKVKTLECLYAGLPVVTTTVGSEGIPNMENMIIEDDISNFSDIIIDIYNKSTSFDGEKSRRFLDAEFDQNSDLKQLNLMVSQLNY